MRYEIQTSTLRPGGVAEAEARYAEWLPERAKLSPLGAFWHTEIGTLNQIVQVWPYEDLAHRDRVHAALDERADWLPELDLALSRQAEIWVPAPFMRPLEPRVYGGIFEMRTYTFRPGTMPRVLEVWEKGIHERERLSPLVACWYSDVGALDRFRHVWAYASLDERARIRSESLRLPHWPPPTREWRVGEETAILSAAAFSPIR